VEPLDAGHLLTRLVEMESALEQGEPRSGELRACLVDLDTALRDSGPAEIGISAKAFLAALSHCRRAEDLLKVDLTPRTARALRKILRRLRRLFRVAGPMRSRGHGHTISSGLAIAVAAVPAVALIAGSVALGSIESGPSLLNGVTVLAVMAFPALWYLLRRSDPSELAHVEALRASVAPEERLLHWHLESSLRHPVRPPVWLATDRRLLLVEPSRGDKPVRIVKSIEYKHLRTLSSTDVAIQGEGGQVLTVTRLELDDGDQQVELTLSQDAAAAMLTTLERRTGLPVDHRTEDQLGQLARLARTLRR
jgi:hypothetical protein